MRQVNIRCLDDDRTGLLLNPHDAVLGMLSILFPLTVSNQIQQFRYMTQRKGATDCDYSRRVTIACPMTGLTNLPVRVYRPGVCPLPAAFLEDGIANRAYSWLWRLAICFVRVMNVLVNQAVFPIGSRNIKFHSVSRAVVFLPLTEFKAAPGSRTDSFPCGHGHIYRPKERSRDHGARFSELSPGER